MALGGGGKVGTGYVEIKPDTKGFGAELERGVGKEGSKAGGKLGKGISLAAKGAFAAGIAGMAKGVLDFGEFDTGMREVFTLMPDLSKEARDQMTANVKSFSAEFGVIPDEVIPSLYNSISAGVPPDNVFAFLEQSQKLAKGGATDLATAVDGLSSVVNAYGPEVLSAADASDSLFTAVKLGKTTVDEMSASLFQIAPIASASGISFQEVSASIATLTAQGTPTSVAATQMKGAIAELGKEGSKAWTAFEEASGKTFPQFIEEGGNLTSALGLMSTYADENDTSISNMFGSLEAGQAALGIVKDLDKSNANLLALGESAGATDVAFQEMNQGLAATMDKLKAKFAVTLIDLGTALAPTIETIGMAIAGLVDGFNALPEPMRTMIVIGGTLLAGIVAFAGPIMRLVQVFKMLGSVMSLLAANPWMIAVLALIAVTYLIIKNWDDVVAALEVAWNWIKDAAEAVAGWFVDRWNEVAGAVTDAWNGMVDGITTAIDAVVGAVEAGWDAVVSAFEWAIETIVDVVEFGFDVISTVVETWIGVHVAIITNAWNVVTGVFNTALNAIKAVTSTIFGQIQQVVETVISGIRWFIDREVNGIRNIVESVWNGIKAVTSTIWGGITASVETAVNTITGIVNRILGFPTTIANGLATLADAIAGPFRAAFSGIQSAWNSTAGGFGFSIPGWVPGVGGKGFTIPSMAVGGLAASPMLAMIGDAGAGDPEVVSPVSLMRETMIDALGSAGGGSGLTVETHLHVDAGLDETRFARMLEQASTEVVRVVVRELDRERGATGRSSGGLVTA